MIGLPFFDPARPPPPLCPPSDEQLVQQFLRTRSAECSQPRYNKPPAPASSISEIKTKMRTLVSEFEQLKSKKETLEKEIQSLPDLDWRTAIEQLGQIQQRIEHRLAELRDPATSEQLRKKLASRRKKRAWLKRRNARLKEERNDGIKRREQLNEAIDHWLQEQRQLLEKEKRAQQELDYASHFLADVHRRKAAAKRYLAKFDKIKESRKQRNEDEGNLAELTKSWTAKLAECIREEKKLKDVLARQSAANYRRRVENEWNRTLFGAAIPKRFEHPLLEADRSQEALVATRWAWDACLTSDDDAEGDSGGRGGGGSSIPLGWVLPPKDPLPEWATYQMKELS